MWRKIAKVTVLLFLDAKVLKIDSLETVNEAIFWCNKNSFLRRKE